MKDAIYSMKLHEKLTPNIPGGYVDIVRVPGGWIYSTYHKENDGFNVSSVFVPFNTEFVNDAD